MEGKISIFSGRFKWVTGELILSAILVSFLEALALWFFGFLRVTDASSFLMMTFVLAVIEIILIILIEEVLISARIAMRSAVRKGRTYRKAKRR